MLSHRCMIWLLIPSPLSRLTRRQRKRYNLMTRGGGEGGRSGVGAKPYDGAKAWSSINNSIFSELTDLVEVALFWGLLLVHRDPDWLQLGHLLLHHPNHQQTNKPSVWLYRPYGLSLNHLFISTINLRHSFSNN